MQETLLDKTFQTAHHNRNALPMYEHFYTALRETTPRAYLWREWEGDVMSGKPLDTEEWAPGAFCLDLQNGVVNTPHSLTALSTPGAYEVTEWLADANWRLAGMLVYSEEPDAFDVVGLCSRTDSPVIFPEAQVHFKRSNNTWGWQYAATGPVNSFFYDAFISDHTDAELTAFNDAIDVLGSTYFYTLGAWLDNVSQPGAWEVFPPKPPKVKEKNGKVKKVLRGPLLGYSVFKREES